jgi:hypothetical protein
MLKALKPRAINRLRHNQPPEAAGKTSLRAIAYGLNAQGIPTHAAPAGGRQRRSCACWSARDEAATGALGRRICIDGGFSSSLCRWRS